MSNENEQAHGRRLEPLADIPEITEVLEDAGLTLDGYTPVVRYWDEAWNEIPAAEFEGRLTS